MYGLFVHCTAKNHFSLPYSHPSQLTLLWGVKWMAYLCLSLTSPSSLDSLSFLQLIIWSAASMRDWIGSCLWWNIFVFLNFLGHCAAPVWSFHILTLLCCHRMIRMTVLSKEKAVDLLTMKSTLKYQDQIQTEGMLLAVLKRIFLKQMTSLLRKC